MVSAGVKHHGRKTGDVPHFVLNFDIDSNKKKKSCLHQQQNKQKRTKKEEDRFWGRGTKSERISVLTSYEKVDAATRTETLTHTSRNCPKTPHRHRHRHANSLACQDPARAKQVTVVDTGERVHCPQRHSSHSDRSSVQLVLFGVARPKTGRDIVSGLQLQIAQQRGRRVVVVSWLGLAVWRKDLGSIPLRLSFLFKKVVVCGHCLVTLSITSY